VLAHERHRPGGDGLRRVVVTIGVPPTNAAEHRAATRGTAVADDVDDVHGIPVTIVGDREDLGTVDRGAVKQCAQVHETSVKGWGQTGHGTPAFAAGPAAALVVGGDRRARRGGRGS